MEYPGERLAHILDQIGFKHGRGRIDDLHKFLVEKRPDVYADLKYTTVRSWFHNSAPPMKKIDIIIEALQNDYVIQYNISQIKTWWKVGGYYPFATAIDSEKISDNSSNRGGSVQPISEQKLQFIVMSLVTEETGDEFNELTGEQLVQIKEKAIQLAKDFADPFMIECPSEYMRMAIRDAMRLSKENNNQS